MRTNLSYAGIIACLLLLLFGNTSNAQSLTIRDSIVHTPYGSTTGSITVTVISGSSPYHYKWSTNDTTNQISSLDAGEYTVTVYDAVDSLVRTYRIGYYVDFEIMNNVEEAPNHTLTCLKDFAFGDLTQNYAFGLNRLPSGSNGFVVFDFARGDDYDGLFAIINHSNFEQGPHGFGFLIVQDTIENFAGRGIYYLGDGEPEYLGDFNDSLPLRFEFVVIDDTVHVTKNGIEILAAEFIREDAMHPVLTAAYEGSQMKSMVCSFAPHVQAIGTIHHPDCGETNGSITTVTEGGESPYHYEWSTADTTSFIDSIGSGIYSLTVSDDNGDSAVYTYSVGSASVWDTLVKFTEDTNGRITSVDPDTGFSSYAYSVNTLYPGEDGWVEFVIAEGDTFSGELALVSDLNFNQYTESVYLVIEDNTILLRGSGIDEVTLCSYEPGEGYRLRLEFSDIKLVVSKSDNSGNRFYTKETLPFPRIKCLSPLVIAYTDNSRIAEVNVTFRCNSLWASVEVVPAEHIATLGSAHLTAERGEPPYTYEWSRGDNTTDLLSARVGEYSVTVTDQNNISVTKNIFIGGYVDWSILNGIIETGSHELLTTGPSQPEINIDSLANMALGANELHPDSSGIVAFDFSADSVFGGVVGLFPNFFNLSSSSQSEDSMELFIFGILPDENTEGLSNVVLFHQYGTGEQLYFLGNRSNGMPLNLKMKLNGDSMTVVKNEVGVLSFPRQRHVALNPIVISSIENARVHHVTCNFGERLKVTSEIIHMSCDSSSGGSITVTPDHGVPPYEYSWSNSATTATISNVGAGEYSVEITDSIGNTSNQNIDVGYLVTWDTINNGAAYPDGALELFHPVNDSLYGIAMGANTLYTGMGELGWLDFKIARGDTFTGLIGFGNVFAHDSAAEDDAVAVWIFNTFLVFSDAFGEDAGYTRMDTTRDNIVRIERQHEDSTRIKLNGKTVFEQEYSYPVFIKPFACWWFDTVPQKLRLECVAASFCNDSALYCLDSLDPVAIIVSDDTVCAGEQITLTATSYLGATMEWFANACGDSGVLVATGDTVIITVDSSTTFYVRNRSYCPNVEEMVYSGCKQKRIVANPLPEATVSPSDTTILPGESLVLTAYGGASYFWPGLNTNSQTVTINPNLGISEYKVITTNTFSCSDSTFSIVRLNPNVLDSSIRLPLYFEKNIGQFDSEMKYRTRVNGTHLRFMEDKISFYKTMGSFAENDTVQMCVWNLLIDSISNNATINGIGIIPPKINYYLSNNPDNWYTNVPIYSAIEYENVYNGISMRYYRADENNLEYDIEVGPNANVADVRLRFEGIQELNINQNEQLEIQTPIGTYIENKPYAYQIINSQEVPVSVAYTLLSDTSYGFEITGNYDNNFTLIIDPITVVWSTYTGTTTGPSEFYTQSLDVDVSGVTYGGDVWELDFFAPKVSGIYTYLPTDPETDPLAFVSRIKGDGSLLDYWTVFGGASQERVTSLKLVSSGHAYVTGHTNSTDFPIVPPYPTNANISGQDMDGFLGYFDANGTPVYLNKFGGDELDMPRGLDIDASGNAVIVGYTNSDNFLSSTTPILQDEQVFVIKINPITPGIAGFTSLNIYGGSGSEKPYDVCINANGDIYICGLTRSGNLQLTPTPLILSSVDNTYDGFILRIVSPNTISWAVIGGEPSDHLLRIKINNDRLYFLGETLSDDLTTFYPNSSPIRDAFTLSGWDGFIGYIDGITNSGFVNGITQISYLDFASIETVYPTHKSNYAFGGLTFDNSNDVIILGLNQYFSSTPVPSVCGVSYIGDIRIMETNADLTLLKNSFTLSGHYNPTKPIIYNSNIYLAQTSHTASYTTLGAYIELHPNSSGNDASTISMLSDVISYLPDAGPDKLICSPYQTSVQIGGNPTFNQSTQLNVEWESNDPNDPNNMSIDNVNLPNPIVSPAVTTTYTVTLYGTNDGQNFCILGTDNVIVTVAQRPSITITPNPAIVCTGGGTTAPLTALDASENIYSSSNLTWSSGSGNPNVVSSAGTYTVTVTDANQCTASASAIVEAVLCCTPWIGNTLTYTNKSTSEITSDFNLDSDLDLINEKFQNRTILINGEFIVNTDDFGFVNCLVVFSKNAKIKLEDSKVLNVDGSVLIPCTEDMWHGIVMPYSDNSITVQPANSLDSYIEGAKLAIDARRNGIVTCSNAFFLGNYNGIRISSPVSGWPLFAGQSSGSTIISCEFDGDFDSYNLNAPVTGAIYGAKGIELLDINGITIGTTDNNIAHNLIHDYNVGVAAKRSNATIVNCDFSDIRQTSTPVAPYYTSGYTSASGIAVYAQGRHLGFLSNPTQLTVTQSDRSHVNFATCPMGIYWDRGTTLSATNNNMDNVGIGIGADNSFFSTVEINDNDFNNIWWGISMSANAMAHDVEIHNNHFWHLNAWLTNSIQYNGINPFSAARVSIAFNEIHDAEFGIYANAVNVPPNDPNRFFYIRCNDIDYNSPVVEPAYGIGLNASQGVVEVINTHIGYSTNTGDDVHGYYNNRSRQNLFLCNSSDNSLRGFEFVDDCTNSALVGNNLGASTFPRHGLHFERNSNPMGGVIGPNPQGHQATSSTDWSWEYGNIFNGTPPLGGDGTFANNSDGFQSPFLYYLGTPSQSNGNNNGRPVPFIDIGPSGAPFFDIDQYFNLGDFCGWFVCPPSGRAMRQTMDSTFGNTLNAKINVTWDEGIVTGAIDTLIDSNYVSATLYRMRKDLYERLDLLVDSLGSPDSLPTTVLKDFYNNNYDGTIGRFSAINETILTLQDTAILNDSAAFTTIVHDLINLNDSVEAEADYELNEQKINRMALNHLLPGKGLTTQEKNYITDLAFSCPFTEGDMVYTARSYYMAWHKDSTVFDDADICNQYNKWGGEEEQAIVKQSKQPVQKGIIVFPNPANTEINILTSLETDETGVIGIYNMTGVKVTEIKVREGITNNVVKVDGFPNGVYGYSLISDKHYRARGKLVIAR